MALVRGLATCEAWLDAERVLRGAFHAVAAAYERGSGGESHYLDGLENDPAGVADALAAASRREE